jgi:tight adherence protein C
VLLPILIFFTVTLLIGGLLLWWSPTRAERRLEAVAADTTPSGTDWTATIVKIAGPLANLSTPEGEWENSPLRLRFLNAGLRRNDMRLYYFAAKTVLPLLLAGIAYTASQAAGGKDGLELLFNVLFAALVGYYLPTLLLNMQVRARQREIFENFPDAADLMLVCIEAGLGLDTSMTRVADEIKRKSVALAEELHLTNLEMRAGGTRETALRNLALRTGVDETATFATMLTQADRFGTSIGESLRVFSDDLRHKRQTRAEERAAKIPTKLLIPLVICIFPSIIMVILGPAIIQIIRTILPMISGEV